MTQFSISSQLWSWPEHKQKIKVKGCSSKVTVETRDRRRDMTKFTTFTTNTTCYFSYGSNKCRTRKWTKYISKIKLKLNEHLYVRDSQQKPAYSPSVSRACVRRHRCQCACRTCRSSPRRTADDRETVPASGWCSESGHTRWHRDTAASQGRVQPERSPGTTCRSTRSTAGPTEPPEPCQHPQELNRTE